MSLRATCLSDGELRDDEKEQIDALLSSIIAPTKSGELILLKNLLLSSQVNPDWPFFSKTDSTIVKRSLSLCLLDPHPFLSLLILLGKSKTFSRRATRVIR